MKSKLSRGRFCGHRLAVNWSCWILILLVNASLIVGWPSNIYGLSDCAPAPIHGFVRRVCRPLIAIHPLRACSRCTRLSLQDIQLVDSMSNPGQGPRSKSLPSDAEGAVRIQATSWSQYHFIRRKNDERTRSGSVYVIKPCQRAT